MKLSKKVLSLMLATLMLLSVIGISASATETAAAIGLVGIEMLTPPQKSAYMEGELYHVAGMSAVATYSDGSQKTIYAPDNNFVVYFTGKYIDDAGNVYTDDDLKDEEIDLRGLTTGRYFLYVKYYDGNKSAKDYFVKDNVPFQLVVYSAEMELSDINVYYDKTAELSADAANPYLKFERSGYESVKTEFTWKLTENGKGRWTPAVSIDTTKEVCIITGIRRGNARIIVNAEDFVNINGRDEAISLKADGFIESDLTFWQWFVKTFLLFGWLGFDIYL